MREIRQRASELIRRAESGEEIIVAVSGRPAARLVPIVSLDKTWRDVAELAGIWGPVTDATWDAERRADQTIDQAVTDPWKRGEG